MPLEALDPTVEAGAENRVRLRSYYYPLWQAFIVKDGQKQPAATAEASFLVSSLYLDKSILGCRYGSSRPQRDIALYADLYREGRLLLDELVTATYPVEDFAKAAEDAGEGRVARAVLTF